jgi:hypothetical protein
VHGIGRTSWLHQRKVEEVTTVPVWTVILEALSGELLAARLTGMEPDDQFGDESRKGVNRGGMVYWRKSRFVLVAQLERLRKQLALGFAA